METCGILRGLEGAAGAKDAVFVRSATAVILALRCGFAATTARDNGAISIWIDDEGKYRAEAYRFCATTDSAILPTQRAVKAWFNELYARIA